MQCLEEDVGLFVDACVLEIESFEAVSVIDDLVEEAEFEIAQVGGVIWAQYGHCSLFERVRLVLRRGETLLCFSWENLHQTAENERSEYMVRTEAMGAART